MNFNANYKKLYKNRSEVIKEVNSFNYLTSQPTNQPHGAESFWRS